MLGPLNRFVDLPPAVRAGVIVAGGGSIAGVSMWMIPSVPRYVPLVLIGLALAGLVVLGFLALLKWRDKRKSRSFDQGLRESGGSSSVSSAGAKAKLDDLRRQFERGVTTFREHGKDLYSLPWYMLVGEPGSGKTEAIRHCNVGFPPGLHDPLQGTGGTVNMNWWFTNKAVILDTAGRLMFEEVEAGRTSEWKEFLRLLRSVRQTCPINGMLLVIPIDSLIKDTADEIQAKGGRIAEQLDAIQRVLGVRFPVFVVITKTDLISGFREFFRDMDDPQLAQQMLGWSNPAGLDEPFNPEQVESHLRSVAERLRRRRMGLLMDPVNREDPLAGRRTNEVDGLFGFPEGLLKIAPRLRLYLEMVFVQGEWSTKPLFLRGIYFTSSMQEGAELDAELADALGVGVGELPPGSGWERNTSYFLRDLFLNKVFREKGLVTRATNALQQQRRARNIVYGTGIAAVLALIGVTALTAGSLERTVGKHNEFWGDVAAFFAPGQDGQAESEKYAIVRDAGAGWKYAGHKDVPEEFGGQRPALAALPVWTYERASEPPPSTPWIYRPVKGIAGSVFSRRAAAHATVVEQLVLEPAVEAARSRLRAEAGDGGDSWSDEQAAQASEVMAELIRAERGAADVGPLRVGPLLAYATEGFDGLDASERERAEAQVRSLQEAIDWTYEPGDGGQRLPNTLRYDADDAGGADPLLVGVEAMERYWTDLAQGDKGVLAQIGALRSAAAAYTAAEASLREIDFERVETIEQYERAMERWEGSFEALASAHEALASAVQPLAGVIDRAEPGPEGIAGALNEAAELRLGELIEDRAETLLSRVGDVEEGRLAEVRSRLESARREAMQSAEENRRSRLAGFTPEQQGLVRTMGSGAGSRVFAGRFGVYQWADRLLPRGEGLVPVESAEGDSPDGVGASWRVPESMAAIVEGLTEMEATVGTPASAGLVRVSEPPAGEGEASEGAALAGALKTAARVRGVVIRHRAHALIDRVLTDVDRLGVGGLVRREVELAPEELDPLPEEVAIPLTKGFDPATEGAYAQGFDDAWNPEGALRVLGALEAIGALLNDEEAEGTASAPLDRSALAERWPEVERLGEGYLEAYRAYWGQDLLDALAFDGARVVQWRVMRAQLDALIRRSDEINESLVRVAQQARQALAMPGLDGASEAGAPGWADRIIESLKAGGAGAREYENRLETVFGNWQYLEFVSSEELPSAEAAREAVLGLMPQEFDDGYLRDVYAENGAPVPYWSEVVFQLVRALANSSEAILRDRLERLQRLGKSFPVSRDASMGDALSRTELESLYQSVRSLGPGSGASVGEPRGALLRDGAILAGDRARVNGVIDELRGSEVIRTADQQDLVTDVLALLEFVRGQEDRPRWLQWELYSISSLEDNEGALTVRRFRVVDDQGDFHPNGAGINTTKPEPESFGRFGVYDEKRSMALEGVSTTTPDADDAWVGWRFPNRWTVLGLLADDRARLDEQMGLWRLPTGLKTERTGGTFFIGVRFGRQHEHRFRQDDPPDFNDWPTREHPGWDR